MREPGSSAMNGGSESRESAKASAWPVRIISTASPTELTALMAVLLSERAAARMVVVLAMPTIRTCGCEIDPLLALLVHRHEGDVDRSRCGRVGDQPGIGYDHELDRHAERPRQGVPQVDRDAARLSARILDDEEGGRCRRENDADPESAGGYELLHIVFSSPVTGPDRDDRRH